MPTTIPEFREWAVANGWFSAETNATFDSDLTSPQTFPAFLDWLRDRNLITAEQIATLHPSAPTADVAVFSEEPTPLLHVPVGHDDMPFVPESIELPGPSSSPTSPRRVVEKPMSRETMWTWIGVGTACWVLGLIILGVWIGGCFSETPKIKPKAKTSQTK